ncbi:MAG: hypothetical protein AAB799_00195 [Patescibacteria group bacterium]
MKRAIFSVLVCLSFISCTRQNCGVGERLKNRFSQADVVIVGEFGNIEKYLLLPTAQGADWRVAYIHVDQVLKGHLNSNTGDSFIEHSRDWTKVYFPNSWDQGWGNSPKFVPGQKGILSLRNIGGWSDLSVYDQDAKVALDYYDFQPLSELENIKKIIAVR